MKYAVNLINYAAAIPQSLTKAERENPKLLLPYYSAHDVHHSASLAFSIQCRLFSLVHVQCVIF